MKKIETMITAFRDGFQSVYGARVFTKDFLPAIEATKAAGISHFEAGGGARFQAPFFYCNENAFDSMDTFRKVAGPDANLQTLARGVNVVALDSQSSDIIKLHAQLFKKHGMTTIRNFDALNDVNNLIYSGQCIHDAGLKHEVVVSMMALPPGCEGAHDAAFYEMTLRSILDAGIPYDSVCFKDASGTATPATIYDTIKRARKMLPAGTKIVFHSHDTAGTCVACYIAAINAGADQVDCSMAPASGGTCQPDVISMWHALRGSEFSLNVDIDKMREAEEVFKECMKDYFLPPEAKEVEPLIPFSPMPGGALTANTQMMRDNGIMNRYPEVIKAMGEVVRLGGFGTSVTPVSQFYFQQAFNNVMFGPWEKIAEGYGKMVLGYFGKTPVAPDAKIVKICAEQLKLEPTTKPVLEINDANPKKSVAAIKKQLTDAGITDLSDENVFIAASCGQKGIDFLLGKAVVNGVRKNEPEKEKTTKEETPNEYTVNVNGKTFGVKMPSDGIAEVNGVTYKYDVKPGTAQKEPEKSSTGHETLYEMVSPLPGLVLRVLTNPGTMIAAGETILVMESMKMETPINVPVSGVLVSIPVRQGEQVQAGHILAVIRQ
jgi:pyruvate carboxylase subunit B